MLNWLPWLAITLTFLAVIIVVLAIMQVRSLNDLKRESQAIWRAVKDLDNDKHQ